MVFRCLGARLHGWIWYGYKHVHVHVGDGWTIVIDQQA